MTKYKTYNILWDIDINEVLGTLNTMSGDPGRENKEITREMTREEAIKEINHVFEPAFANYIITALTEGATKSDRCEDAVSRKAILEYQQSLHGKMPNKENYKLWEFITDLPSVAPKQQWIPVSERLPEDTGWYLVTFKAYGGGDVVSELSYRKPENYWTDADISCKLLDNNEIVAWMPIPPKPDKVKIEKTKTEIEDEIER